MHYWKIRWRVTLIDELIVVFLIKTMRRQKAFRCTKEDVEREAKSDIKGVTSKPVCVNRQN